MPKSALELASARYDIVERLERETGIQLKSWDDTGWLELVDHLLNRVVLLEMYLSDSSSSGGKD